MHGGGAAILFGAGRGHFQIQVAVEARRRRQGQPFQVIGAQRPGAVAIVGTGRQHRALGHAGDGHGERLRAVGVGQRGGDIQRNGAVLAAGHIGDTKRRQVGAIFVDGRRHRGGAAAVGFGGGGGDAQRQVLFGLGRNGQGQPGKLVGGQRPRAVAIVGAGRQERAIGQAVDRDRQGFGAVRIGQGAGDIERIFDLVTGFQVVAGFLAIAPVVALHMAIGHAVVVVAAAGTGTARQHLALAQRHRQRRRVGDRLDGDRNATGRGRGRGAIGRRRLYRQGEVLIAVVGRRDGQAVQLIRVQRPTAVAVVGTRRQGGARRHTSDGDRQGFGAVGVGQRGPDIKGDGAVLVARRIGKVQRRRIGDRLDGDVEAGAGFGQLQVVGGGDGQGEIGVGIFRWGDGQVAKIGQIIARQGPGAVAVIRPRRQQRAGGHAGNGDRGKVAVKVVADARQIDGDGRILGPRHVRQINGDFPGYRHGLIGELQIFDIDQGVGAIGARIVGNGQVAGFRVLGDGVIGEVAREHRRVDTVAAIQHVVAGAAGQQVVAGATIQHVVAGTAFQDVVAAGAVKNVGAFATVECVVAGTAVNRVVTGTTGDKVIAFAAAECVVAGPAINVHAVGEHQLLDPAQGIGAVDAAIVVGHGDVAGGLVDGDGIFAGVTGKDRGVGAAAANQNVVAAGPHQDVVAEGAIDHVIFDAADQNVVAGRADQIFNLGDEIAVDVADAVSTHRDHVDRTTCRDIFAGDGQC